MGRFRLRLTVLLALAALPSGAAQAELQLTAYGGGSHSFSSDISFSQGGSSTTFNDVGWDSETFKLPVHWGARATWWFDAFPNWGVAVDFTHAKAKADPLPPGFQALEFSHGLNALTANALYRHPTGTRLTPYGGLGIGVAIPHVEVTTATSRTYEFQMAGLAAQGLLGIDLRIWRGLSLFGEYKLGYTQNDVDLSGGGSLETDIWTNFFGVGISYSFR